MTDLDKILGTDAKEESAPEAPKKSKKSTPKVEATPQRENPIPLAPIQDGKMPGDAGYNYQTALVDLNEQANEVKAQAEALRVARQQLNGMRAQSAAKPMTDVERNASLRKIHQRLEAEEAEKRGKIAAVIAELGLS